MTAYVLRMSVRGQVEDRVRTLDDARVEQLATVDEQHAFWKEGLGSIRTQAPCSDG